jgi:hypothetical protein
MNRGTEMNRYSDAKKGGRAFWGWILAWIFLWAVLSAVAARGEAAPDSVTLADYSKFPEGWKIKGNKKRAAETYRVVQEGGQRVLEAKVTGDPIRIFKKVPWDPYTHPVLKWRWRVLKWPDKPGSSVDVYVSIERDFMRIPTFVKYRWSDLDPLGTEHEGGAFSPPIVVIESGREQPGKWIDESVNVFENYERLRGSDPDHEAYGVGLLVSSGVVMEISEIVAVPAGGN